MTAGVAAGHPSTVEAGLRLLSIGANAADAAAGAILASCVAETVLTGLGGGGFASYYDAQTGQVTCLDFFCDLPERSTALVPVRLSFDGLPLRFNIGGGSVAVPGTPAGVWQLHRRWGRLPWSKVVAPAAELAQAGVALPAAHATTLETLAPAMLLADGGPSYAPDGKLLSPGQLLLHPGLAESLALLAERGPEPFYCGDFAKQLVVTVQGEGGRLSLDDLARYQVRCRPVVETTFAGQRVLGRCDLSRTLETLGSLEALQRLPVTRHTRAVADALVAHAPEGFGSTTNLAVVDEFGNACVATTTLGIGSGIWVPGTGVHLNSMLGELELADPRLLPGDRLPSNMCPLVVLDGSGEVLLALGAAGSSRIRSALVQTLANALVRGMEVTQAIERPRFHVVPSPGAGLVHVEVGYPEAELEPLAEAGYELNRWSKLSHYFGGVSAIGSLGAAGDPRRGGSAAYL